MSLAKSPFQLAVDVIRFYAGDEDHYVMDQDGEEAGDLARKFLKEFEHVLKGHEK